LRLGGYEAPPPIISAFLGDTVSSIVDDIEIKPKENLKNEVPNLPFNLLQEDADRNRTSPFAYTGNKFEFRAVGASQNVCYPISVIAVTMADAMREVCAKLDSGKSVDEVICEMREETKPIRYSGNGYSREWVETAKSRGLYVNEKFYENYQNLREAGKIFVEMEICKEQELQAKIENNINCYINTVIA
jgi:glutamine synthetase